MTRASATASRIASFRKAFKAAHDPERARNEKRYLKSPFRFFGVTLPFIERMAKDFKKANRDMDRESVFALAQGLWASDYHQEKTLSIKLLKRYAELLDLNAMPMLEGMLASSTGWDHVDGIAIHLVGEVLKKDRKAYGYLKRWGGDENFWIRRASLIAQILPFREGNGDKDLFFRNAERMIEEKEFFIRKGMGWALRELSGTAPGAVFDFLMKFRERASGLTLREGSKKLPEAQKRLILGDKKTRAK